MPTALQSLPAAGTITEATDILYLQQPSQTVKDTKATLTQIFAAVYSAISGKLAKASNLGDLVDAATARTNLGLGSAATQASSAFDVAGAAATVSSALSPAITILQTVVTGKASSTGHTAAGIFNVLDQALANGTWLISGLMDLQFNLSTGGPTTGLCYVAVNSSLSATTMGGVGYAAEYSDPSMTVSTAMAQRRAIPLVPQVFAVSTGHIYLNVQLLNVPAGTLDVAAYVCAQRLS
jgi:hypothetical protein